MIKIPLFPLNIVVLPFEEVPLHIFEPRYKKMIKDSIENNTPFGIVLNNNGSIDNIGCSLNVTKIIKQYNTGEYDLIAKGNKCFQVFDKVKKGDLWIGDIEYMDTPMIENDKILKQVQNKYLELLIKLRKEENIDSHTDIKSSPFCSTEAQRPASERQTRLAVYNSSHISSPGNCTNWWCR